MSWSHIFSSRIEGASHAGVFRAALFSILVSGVVASAALIGDTYCLKTVGADAIEQYEVTTAAIGKYDERIESVNHLTVDDVTDADVLEEFHRVLDSVHVTLGRRPVDTDGVRFHDEAEFCASFNESLNSDLEEALSDLDSSLAAVEKSHQSHLLDVSLHDLKKSIADGQGAYDGTAGRVVDDSTRNSLKEAIEQGTYLIDGGTIDRDALDNARESIDSARSAVLESKASWEAARSRISSGVTRRASVHTTPSGSGAWNVSYRGTDDPNYANADGSVSEWKSGYYIAHDWSYGGGQIASKPGTVVVNGRTYRYVSSMVVSRDTTWSQVSGFVYANGGIGFQTCYGNGYLITHYEPV